MRVDARLRVLFLVGVALGVFAAKTPLALALLGAALSALWLAVGLGPRRLVRQVTKLWGFAALVLLSYGLTAEDPAVDRWAAFSLFGASLRVNLGGLVAGALMLLRIVCVILASQVARAGDPRAIAAGLAAMHAPKGFALSLDAVLALLGGDTSDGVPRRGGGGGGGRGDGSGRGRRRAEGGRSSGEGTEGPKGEGIFAAAKRIARGDVGPLRDRILQHIERAERHVAASGASRDVAVVAGVALTMLGIKALKILPSVPFAPGHKLVLLTPLYIAAALLTRARLGATWTGLTMGVCAFLLGDGKYGVFEILKHVTPGLVIDLLVPLLVRQGPPGRIALGVVGALSGAARFATIFAVMLLVQPPRLAFALLVPGLLVHTTFGAISGVVSAALVRLVMPHRPEAAPQNPEADAADAGGAPSEPIVKEGIKESA